MYNQTPPALWIKSDEWVTLLTFVSLKSLATWKTNCLHAACVLSVRGKQVWLIFYLYVHAEKL